MEFFSWRSFKNGKEVGKLAGLTPTPKDSGKRFREQGIGKDGSRHIRGSVIEVAWAWLRFQPESQLSKWFEKAADDATPGVDRNEASGRRGSNRFEQVARDWLEEANPIS